MALPSLARASLPNLPASVLPAELKLNRDWVQQHLLVPNGPWPFSFTCGQQSSAALLASWKRTVASNTLDQNRTEHLLTWTEPDSDLEVRCRAVEYQDFPTIEWTLYFRNAGAQETPVLADIRAIDANFSRTQAGEFLLHHNTGDSCFPGSYEPFQKLLEPKSQTRFAPDGGRPINGRYPYFNLAYDGGGVIAVLGWPGQWSAGFERDEGLGLRLTGGQELTRLKLLPGEEIRTPLVVLQFWQGDWIRAQNLWRRWMIAHNLPRPGGKLPPPLTSVCLGLQQSEKTEKDGIDSYVGNHAGLDYWWMDAGWYPTDQGWPKVGTWEPDPQRFPNGIKAVSDYAHAKGLKMVLWFEPERVVKGTWLFEKHPEWLLGNGDTRLLNLGNPQARQWLTDHIDTFLTREGIDLYRQDFNFDPLGYWRAADAPDRQGYTENLHVQGYLAYWDELRRRRPHMLIDSCASGGRRNDLETLRRAVPLLRSDYQEPQNPNDPNMVVGNQGHTYGLSFWVPYYGTGQFANDSYGFRSHLCPAMGIGFVPGKEDWAAWHRAKEDWRRAGPNFYGDYYPLTSYSLADDAWIAWQFHRPEVEAGMVQAFRRPRAADDEMRFKLRGLDRQAIYDFENVGTTGTVRFTGRQLIETGLRLGLAQPRQAALICYKRVTGLAAVLSTYEFKGEAPLPVALDGNDSASPAGRIAAYEWVFGDGATASGPAASHTYTAPGRYRATLTIRDEKGNADAASALITVTPTDLTPPTIRQAAAGRADRVVVTFSEPVERAGAETVSNYALDQGVRVLSAALAPNGSAVRLAVTPLTENVFYTLLVSGIKDGARNPNTIAPRSSVKFSFSGLAARWKLDEGKDALAADSSGNGFYGTLREGAAWSDGPRGKVLSLKSGAFVETDTCLEDLELPFSLAFWVNPAESQVEYADILGNHADGYLGLSVQQDGARTNQFGFGLGDGAKWQGAGPIQLTANRWQHVAVVCDGTNATMFLDGHAAAQGAVHGHFAPNRGLKFMLGRGYTAASRYFTGQLADVRIYRRALTPADVQSFARKENLPKN